jgi:RNA polymerase sigma-70 factor (family 1)
MEPVQKHTDIISKFHEGDEAAVRHVYHLHYRAICYFAEQLINDKAEAEDIAVNTFIKLLNKRTDFDNLTDIKSFLYTAARNACFDLLRRNKVKDKLGRELAYLSAPDEQFGEQEMIIAKVLQVIYVEAEKLPGQCKQVFKLIFMEGKSTAIVASEMNISPQTVLNQKNKALQVLRLNLQKEGLYSAGVFLYCLFLLAKTAPS